MKNISIQGVFTHQDLLDLITIFSLKGAKYAVLCYKNNKKFESIETEILQQGIDPDVSGLWLNTVPFFVKPTPYPKIGADFPGSFGIFFHGCTPKNDELGESTIGTISPAMGNQLKIWESGLRLWKKRIIRDVHMFSRVLNRVFPNEKMNISKDAIAGYEQGKWKLVAGFSGGALLVHPIAVNKEIPFDMTLA